MRRSTERNRRRHGAVALNLALVLGAGSVVAYAVSAQGYQSHEPDLNDGGIWVTDSQLSSFGRINKPIGQLDSIVFSDSRSTVDILQQSSAVVGENLTSRRLTVIDPTTSTPVEGQQAQLPQTSQVWLAGSTLAVLDTSDGRVWATRVEPEGALPSVAEVDRDTTPEAQAGANAGLAVTQSGTVLVASARTDTLTRLAADGAGLADPTSEDLEVPLEGAPSVTAVGETPVILDQATGQLTVVGGARAVVDVGSVLQQPGPDADSVLLETPTALISVNLTTGALETIATVESGSPTAPVRLGTCEFGAWSGGRGYVSSRCAGGEASTVALNHHTSDLVFRVNRGQILLNDRLSGAVWNIDDAPTKIDNWEAFRNPNADNDKSSEQHNDNPGDRRPPKARNDSFGARPGRTTVTHPLDNDSAPAGRMLAVSSVEQLSGQSAPATISPDGQTVQFQLGPNASGNATYEYYITDGRRDVGAHARITVGARKKGNQAPRLRQGFKAKTWAVAPSGTITLPVLSDWRDPADGDALDVVSATLPEGTAGASVRTTTDGRIRFTAPTRPGSVKLTYAVSDGRSQPVPQQLAFRVQDPDRDEPVAATAEPDIVTAEVGQRVTIRPLANDLPGADPLTPDAQLRLAGEVTSPRGAQVETDLTQATISFRATQAKSYFLDYDAAYGEAPLGSGKIRVDVRQRERRGPVAMPDTATLYGTSPAIVDVLANDDDPGGGVLMVQSARALSSGQLDIAVVDGRWLRISAREGELRPKAQVLRYVVSNGGQTAVGEVQVTQRPVPPDNTPVTETDQVSVREGSSAAIPVLDNDFSPSGDQLTLVGDVAGQKSGRLEVTGPDGSAKGVGEAFTSGRLVRYVAPERVRTANTVTITYVARNSQGETAPGRIKVTVLPETKHNQLPVAPILEGRVVAGDTVTLRLPGSGIDPDGDGVTVIGLGSAPALGRVVKIGANSIEYQAYPTSTGTDEFDYLITDARGGRATGTARVAVTAPGLPQPPLAVADDLTVEPGRQATVFPMANDYVAPGDRATVELVDPPAGVTLAGDAGPVLVQTPKRAAGRNIEVVYRLSNGVDTTQSTITVRTAEPYNNPPVVADAFGNADDSAAVRVNVLKSAYDPDGPTSELRVTDVYAADAKVTPGGRITVLRDDHARVIPFRVEDADGGVATANLYVPPTGSGLPYVKAKALIKLGPGEQRKVSLGDYIVNPSGGPIRLAPTAQVLGSPPGLITVVAGKQDTLTVGAASGYRGPGAAMVEVSARGERQPVVLSIPVQVGDAAPILSCPEAPITLTSGETRPLDIASLCHVFTSTPDQLASLVYHATWAKDVTGLKLVSARGREIEVAATGSAKTGTEGVLLVTAAGSKPGKIRVRVETPPAPTLAPITVTDLKAGESRTLDLGRYLTPGVPDGRPTVVSVDAVRGRGVTATKAGGDRVRISAAAAAQGNATFRVTMSDVADTDQPDRQASNLLTVRLLGVPDIPGAPVIGDGQFSGEVRLSWRAPANNGSPIDRYEVKASNGATRTCPTTSCRFSGLDNGTAYTFTVRAHNAVGWSDYSGRSKPAEPEGVPGVVGPIAASKLGDGQLTITWAAPTLNGKHIDKYRVVWQGHRDYVTSRSYIAAPLDNNKKYRFTVYAHNSAGWGPGLTSGPLQSSGSPGTPDPPVITPLEPTGGETVTLLVSWKPVLSGSADALTYTLTDDAGRNVPGCTKIQETSCRIPGIRYDGRSYRYRVTAVSADARTSDFSDPWKAIAAPLSWGAWSWKATGQDTKAQLNFTVPNSRGDQSKVTISVDGSPVSNQQATGSVQQTISVGDNDRPHDVVLKVCNEGGQCSTSSTQRVQTYGPLTSGMVKATPVLTDGTKVRWQIEVDPNGAPVDVIFTSDRRPGTTWHIDAVDTQTLTTGTVDLGYSVTEHIGITVRDTPRGRRVGPLTFQKSTDDPPPATVDISRGDKCNDSGANPCHTGGDANPDCTDSSCGFIVLEVHHFFGPVSCSVSADGAGDLGTVSLSDDTTKQTTLYFGDPGKTVRASCTSSSASATDRFDWPG